MLLLHIPIKITTPTPSQGSRATQRLPGAQGHEAKRLQLRAFHHLVQASGTGHLAQPPWVEIIKACHWDVMGIYWEEISEIPRYKSHINPI